MLIIWRIHLPEIIYTQKNNTKHHSKTNTFFAPLSTLNIIIFSRIKYEIVYVNVLYLYDLSVLMYNTLIKVYICTHIYKSLKFNALKLLTLKYNQCY